MNEEETRLTYDIAKQKLTLDCSKSGKQEDGIRHAALDANGLLTLRMFIDRSSIEVFANDGQVTMTSRMYPKEERVGFELFTTNNDVKIKDLTYWTLKDIWK
jgi:beta-fructofuranosidase